MATKLRKLKIDRVDLVDRGANQEAHILLFKRDALSKSAMTLQEVLDMREAEEEKQELCWKATDAFMASLNSVAQVGDDAERLRIIVTSARQYVDLMQTHQPQEEKDVYMADTPNEELEALKAEVATLKEANNALTKSLDDTRAELAKRDEPEEDIWKGVPPALKKMFDDQQRETEIAKAAAQAERDERIRRDCIQKAATYEFLPVNPNGDWEVFKAIDGLDSAVSTRIYQLFKAGDANMTGLTRERGSGGGGGGGATPLEEIERLVSKRMAETAGAVTYDAALQQVARENPALYKAYTNGTKINVGRGE